MKNVYSVGQINAYIKNMFDQDFLLRNICIKGEISNCKYHPSGHIYFSMKDDSGTIPCVMFAGARKGLAFRMRDGQQVLVTGTVSVYERDGRYQMYASKIQLDGEGLLYEKFQALKEELEEMGMFAQEYKRPIPFYVKKLGIVTASTGAAIRDICSIARRRNPFIQLVLYPALVQGEGAAASIVKGIQTLDAYGVDVLIVGRGGGSIEDLWAFNEEEVARAIFACQTPVISAVGHETDFTIADFVADLRAPTPSAAAELAVADVRLLLGQLDSCAHQLNRLLETVIREKRQRLAGYQLKIEHKSPESQIREKRQHLADLEEAMGRLLSEKVSSTRQELVLSERTVRQLMERNLMESRHRMMLYVEKMKGLSPLEKLNQGYAWLSDENDQRIAGVSMVKPGMTIHAQLKDGSIHAVVQDVEDQDVFKMGYKRKEGRT